MLTERARGLLARVLDAPGGMTIATIHGFCQSLLRRFPLEAGIAPHFAVADERDTVELLRIAQNSVLRRARETGGDATLAAAFDEVSSHVNDLDFLDLLAELARHRARLRTLRESYDSEAELMAAPHGWLGLEPDETEAALIQDACALGGADQTALTGACEALDTGSDADRALGSRIRAWLEATTADRIGAFADYTGVFVTKAAPPELRKTLITRQAREADEAALPALETEQARIHQVVGRLASLRVARSTAALLVIGIRLVSAYDRAKERRAILDFDDQILLVRDRLLAESAAWVLYKLDGGIDHVLLDEAQDTSPAQWDVVAGLCEEFFTGAGARETGRTLFVVGDEKQSIFSFQGAEPRALDSMRENFRSRVKAVGAGWRDVPLELSFRSTRTVLDAIDAVFAQGDAADGVSLSGAAIRHEAHRAGQAGRVELWPTVAPRDEPDGPPWEMPLAQQRGDDPSGRLARRIARQIRSWLDSGERLDARDRPIRPGDIMLLVQRRTGFLDELARELKTLKIPVAGVDRMVLTEQIAIMDLLALGRFLLLPEDDLSLAGLLKSPLIGLSEDELLELASGREGQSLWRALSERSGGSARFGAARNTLAALLARTDYVSPFELYAEVLGPRGGRRALIGRLGHEAGDPIDEFLGLALDYQRQHAPSLQGFLAWVEAGAAQIKRDLEQGRDEVRLMTVHGAKGLQAPLVILPDTVFKPTRLSPVFWTDHEAPRPLWPGRGARDDHHAQAARERAKARRDEEYRRLLYVALTRAEDRLYICGYETRRARPEGCWYDLVRRALEPIAKTVGFDFTGEGAHGWSGDGLCLTAPQEAAPSPDGLLGEGAPSEAALPAFAKEPAPPESPPTRPLSPSQSAFVEPAPRSPLEIGQVDPFARGRLVHRLLERIPALEPAARDDALHRYLDNSGHGLEAGETVEIAAEIRRVMADPEFAALFAPGSRAEVPIAGRVGNIVIAGQIDRLAVTENGVLIVDYKTNRPPPESPAEAAPAYLAQMAAYRAVLRQVYPEQAIRCALLWTDGPRLMSLPDALLDGFVP